MQPLNTQAQDNVLDRCARRSDNREANETATNGEQ